MRVKSVDGIDARRLPIDKDAGAVKSGNHLPSLHFSPETGSIPAVAGTIPGGMPPHARREQFHRILRGLFIKVVPAWPMMSLQQLSHEPDTGRRLNALPVVRMLPVYRRRAGNFISGTPSTINERPALVAGLFAYGTGLRRGAQLTWQTKCLSTPPTKRRHA
jgi:hypothetical protein